MYKMKTTDNLKEFFEFITERQNVWYRRFILKLSPPWTDDKVLQEYKFTNIHRILDRTTQYYVNNVVLESKNNRDLLFRTIMFRVFNRIDTWEEMGNMNHIDIFDVDKIYEVLRKKEIKDGASCFTFAFMVTGVIYPEEKSKIMKYLKALDVIRKDDNFYELMINERSMEKVCYDLQHYKGIGGFLSQQIATDLSYTNIVRYDQNQWTFFGGGASRGLELATDKQFKNNQQRLEYLRVLVEQQHKYFKLFNLEYKFDIPIPEVVKHCKTDFIHLNDFENCCCEFSKYYHLKRETKKGKKRKFFMTDNDLYLKT